MTPWQITAGMRSVELTDGRAEVVFTVSNPGPVDDRATVDVVGSEHAAASWFSVAEPQRLVPHGGSVTFTVVVTPPAQAPAGKHWLSGRVYSADAPPEENSVTSEPVSFEIAPAEPKPKSKLWLWLLIGGGLLAVVVGVVLFLVLSGDDEPAAVKRGEFTLHLGEFIDVDEAARDQQGMASHDLAYQQISEIPAGFRANHGAVIANLVPEGSEADVIAECRTTQDVTDVISAEQVLSGVGTFCARTPQGSVALISIISRPEFALSVSITTYPPEEP